MASGRVPKTVNTFTAILLCWKGGSNPWLPTWEGIYTLYT